MTREDIIKLAREADINIDGAVQGCLLRFICVENDLERFAALVAAAEREACAKVCDAVHARHIAEHGDYLGETYAVECADAIRARRQE